MSATIHMGNRTAIQLDAVKGTPLVTVSGVLLSIEGKYHGDVLNCCLIPLDKVGTVIESLKLVASQAVP